MEIKMKEKIILPKSEYLELIKNLPRKKISVVKFTDGSYMLSTNPRLNANGKGENFQIVKVENMHIFYMKLVDKKMVESRLPIQLIKGE
jgi:hypothetical protein